MDLLIDYAIRTGDRSLASRLGFLLERLGIQTTGLPVSTSPICWTRARQPRRIDSRWQSEQFSVPLQRGGSADADSPTIQSHAIGPRPGLFDT